MKKHRDSRGFTIIEVTLFLALSSFLIIMATRAIGSRTKTVQFTDAVRGIESFIERRTAQVEAGSIIGDTTINCSWNPSAPSSPRYDLVGPSDGSCTFLGYMFEFGDPDNASATDPAQYEIHVYQMFGRRLTSTDVALCPDPNEPLVCAEPVRIPQTPVETYTIPWQTRITHTLYNSPKAVGYLRNPAGQNILPVAISRNATAVSNFQTIFDSDPSIYKENLPLHPNSVVGKNFNAGFCLTDLEDRVAQFWFGSDERQEAIDVVFDSSINSTPCGSNPAFLM